MTYTLRGQMSSVVSPLKRVSRYEYAQNGDLTKAINPLGNEFVIARDSVGRTISVNDPLGAGGNVELNGISQITRATDALGQETRLAFDDARRLQSVTNPLNNIIESYQYDDGDRVTRRTDALNRSATMEYDSAGRLARATDRKGQSNSFNYDPLGRIVSIIRPDGSQYLTYDAVGRVTAITTQSAAYVTNTRREPRHR